MFLSPIIRLPYTETNRYNTILTTNVYTTIKEIPIEKLDILINKMGIIIENSKENKNYTFDIIQVIEFINNTADEIIKIIATEQ
jgi:hypothetical protein